MKGVQQTRRSVTILGATGSVGDATLAVIRENADQFDVFAISAHQHEEKLFRLCVEFQPEFAVISSPAAANSLQQKLKSHGVLTNVLPGLSGLERIAAHEKTDIVVAAIVGAAGLQPTLAAIKSSKRVLLANKESLVMAGALFMKAVQQFQAELLPLDSEHNAIFQCLPKPSADTLVHHDLHAKGISKLILTASGGPFLHTETALLSSVTPAQACAHPNWDMGKKISVDSATMMNKGLEWIEACWLFNLPADKVEVLIHPQSIIHSMVEYSDSSILAQLSHSDMKVPIAHALGWPDRITSGVKSLNFREMSKLEFLPVDEVKFPCLGLARQAFQLGGVMPTVLNAANEVAVGAFLNNQIGYIDIANVIELVTSDYFASQQNLQVESLEHLIEVDIESRRLAQLSLGRFDKPGHRIDRQSNNIREQSDFALKSEACEVGCDP